MTERCAQQSMNRLWLNARVVRLFRSKLLPVGDCVAWTGDMRHSACGAYPKMAISVSGIRRPYRAHVLGWEIAGQHDWPKGMIARHTCDNTWCVNPAHIVPGTNADNSRDMVLRGRHRNQKKTHCKSGHPLSGENLTRERAWRRCRECIRAKSRKYYHNKKAAEGITA